MTTATATATAATAIKQLEAMGIKDLEREVLEGRANAMSVYLIVKARIDRRTKDGRTQLRPVVEFANKLAELVNSTNQSTPVPTFPVPVYTQPAQPNAAIPTDPSQLADVIVATVGLSNLAEVISALTARIVGSSATGN